MNVIYVLVIMAYGAADGGRAIDTSQHFISPEECLKAAADIKAYSGDRFTPTAVCIKRTIPAAVGGFEQVSYDDWKTHNPDDAFVAVFGGYGFYMDGWK